MARWDAAAGVDRVAARRGGAASCAAARGGAVRGAGLAAGPGLLQPGRAGGAADPAQAAVGGWRLAQAFLRAGDHDSARSAATAAWEDLEPTIRAEPRPDVLCASGALRLCGAVAAARCDDRADASALLDDARATADRLGTDRNDHWLTFGPTNTAAHAVSIAVELGDPDTALAAAGEVDPARFLTLERQATHRVHLAAALLMRRRPEQAYRQLLAAERLNPEGLPHDMMAREFARGLLRRKGRQPPGLPALATRLRVVG
jgi:hypothetical protein